MTNDAPALERTALRVALADEDTAALEELATLLEGLGHDVTGLALSVSEAIDRIIETDPEMAIVVVHADEQHALDLVSEMAEALGGPVIVLAEAPTAAFLAAAADRGINAYAASMRPEEVQGAIEVGLRLYEERQSLTSQVSVLERALERRAVIEQARGILMERHDLDAASAFVRLQHEASARGQRVVGLAHDIVTGQESSPI